MVPVPFPLAAVSDIINQLKAKAFMKKAFAKDLLALSEYAVDQLPDDVAPVPVPAPTAPTVGAMPPDFVDKVVVDLEALCAAHAHTDETKKLAAIGAFNFAGLWAKLQTLIPILLPLIFGA